MFYIASVITFSVFSELLRKSTLFVHYKLNSFRLPQIEIVWYLCTVVWKIRHVYTVGLNGILWLVETYLQVVHRCHS